MVPGGDMERTLAESSSMWWWCVSVVALNEPQFLELCDVLGERLGADAEKVSEFLLRDWHVEREEPHYPATAVRSSSTYIYQQAPTYFFCSFRSNSGRSGLSSEKSAGLGRECRTTGRPTRGVSVLSAAKSAAFDEATRAERSLNLAEFTY